MWCGFLFTCINSGSHKVSITLIFRYSFIAKMCHTVLDNTQPVLRDMTSQEHCRHPQGMNFKDITKDTTQDTILDTLRYAKKCSIATVGLSVLCCRGSRGAGSGSGALRPATGSSALPCGHARWTTAGPEAYRSTGGVRQQDSSPATKPRLSSGEPSE